MSDTMRCDLPVVTAPIAGKVNFNAPFGTPERGRHILQQMGANVPTDALIDAYFANLRAVVSHWPRRRTPGKVALGIGTGRCGSTTLSALIKTVAGGCSTHENPPIIFWHPHPKQVAFHLKRLAILSNYATMVFDAAHWWLNVLPDFKVRFPAGKIVALVRNLDECAASFLNIKDDSIPPVNNWAPPDSPHWTRGPWNSVYPTYDNCQASSLVELKLLHAKRYIAEYNTQISHLCDERRSDIMCIHTETLGATCTQESLFAFLGVDGRFISKRYNVETVSEGNDRRFRI